MDMIARLFASLVLAVLCVAAAPAWAQEAYAPRDPSPDTVSPAAPVAAPEPARFAGMVTGHNRARRAVGVPDLAWSASLAATAQSWADRLAGQGCAIGHSGAVGLGENLAWASGRHLTNEEVVNMWEGEARAYSPATGACLPGGVCGHYTQVVWRDTRFVGCGMASCGNSEVWVCNYSPPGNYIGQRPY
jgi:uncharacterized protein YkwD